MRTLSQEALQKIEARAREAKRACQSHCVRYNFKVKFHPQHPGIFFLQYIHADVDGGELKSSEYQYLCFDATGEETSCEPYFSTFREEAIHSNLYITITPLAI
jgi:hypothetical protein